MRIWLSREWRDELEWIIDEWMNWVYRGRLFEDCGTASVTCCEGVR